ncbi:unnamed protein product [Echinostoma caproni]|uniref:MSP domain-containing protein n=1 Tax=Echinostoma caproni TaxID=27848 RepID=A0A183AGP6_9TREM|nr:unnamed protein product [Echinostoma caproni]
MIVTGSPFTFNEDPSEQDVQPITPTFADYKLARALRLYRLEHAHPYVVPIEDEPVLALNGDRITVYDPSMTEGWDGSVIRMRRRWMESVRRRKKIPEDEIWATPIMPGEPNDLRKPRTIRNKLKRFAGIPDRIYFPSNQVPTEREKRTNVNRFTHTVKFEIVEGSVASVGFEPTHGRRPRLCTAYTLPAELRGHTGSTDLFTFEALIQLTEADASTTSKVQQLTVTVSWRIDFNNFEEHPFEQDDKMENRTAIHPHHQNLLSLKGDKQIARVGNTAIEPDENLKRRIAQQRLRELVDFIWNLHH